MNDYRRTLLHNYTLALKAHLARPHEESLHCAYKIGRDAAHHGLGILDMTALHQRALRGALSDDSSAETQKHIETAYDFFTESLSPYEMLLRGCLDTNTQLITVNKALQEAKTASEALLLAYKRTERVATSFQEAALPVRLPQTLGFHFDAYYRSAASDSNLGGDWYDALRLADGRIILSIGDVGGSGLSAAVIMVTVRQVIRGVAYIHPDPIMILEAADKALRAEQADLYVSAFVGVIDPIEMTLTYASAGHPSPLLRQTDGGIRELADNGVLLGVRAQEGARTAKVTDIPVGSLLVLYTDGLVETGGDILAGETKLRNVISHRAVTSKRGAARAIFDDIITDPTKDDVAILVIEVEPSPFHTAGEKRAHDISHWMFDAADASTGQHARTQFTAQLSAAGAHSDDVYGAELVFGELIGNVLRYAPGPVEVFVDWSAPAPVLHVRDHGPGFSYAPRLPRDIFSENGRGLFIVASLTDDCNVTRSSHGGSHARAVIALNHNPLSHPVRTTRSRTKVDQRKARFKPVSADTPVAV